MALYECKCCGGRVIPDDQKPSLGVCESCGTVNSFPSLSDEKKNNLYNRANKERMAMHFDKAMGIYETILDEDLKEAEAHFGVFLCTYGVEYVKDKDDKLVMTCHRNLKGNVLDDINYNYALEYSDGERHQYYKEEGKKLAKIQKEIFKISSREKPYDVFISFKAEDSDGNRTIDSINAQDIYNKLSKEGYRVFYSKETLKDFAGEDYEPYIYGAIYSSKVMIVVGSSKKNLESVWVKNEWMRFVEIVEENPKKLIIPVRINMDPDELPSELSIQNYDFNEVGFYQDLISKIDKVCKKKEELVSNYSGNIGKTLERAYNLLEELDYDKAKTFFDKVLDEDPACEMAYLGKILCKSRCVTVNGLSSDRNVDTILASFNSANGLTNESVKLEDVKEFVIKGFGKDYDWYLKYAKEEEIKELDSIVDDISNKVYDTYSTSREALLIKQEEERQNNIKLENIRKKEIEERNKRIEQENLLRAKNAKKERIRFGISLTIGILCLVGSLLLFVFNPYFAGALKYMINGDKFIDALKCLILVYLLFSISTIVVANGRPSKGNDNVAHGYSLALGVVAFIIFMLPCIGDWISKGYYFGMVILSCIWVLLAFVCGAGMYSLSHFIFSIFNKASDKKYYILALVLIVAIVFGISMFKFEPYYWFDNEVDFVIYKVSYTPSSAGYDADVSNDYYYFYDSDTQMLEVEKGLDSVTYHLKQDQLKILRDGIVDLDLSVLPLYDEPLKSCGDRGYYAYDMKIKNIKYDYTICMNNTPSDVTSINAQLDDLFEKLIEV